jgi:hypothetical protein
MITSSGGCRGGQRLPQETDGPITKVGADHVLDAQTGHIVDPNSHPLPARLVQLDEVPRGMQGENDLGKILDQIAIPLLGGLEFQRSLIDPAFQQVDLGLDVERLKVFLERQELGRTFVRVL